MLRPYRFVALTAILFFVLFPCSFGNSFASSTFSFRHESHYIDETGIYHLYGEIQNDSPQPMNQILITASFTDSQGHAIGNASGSPAITTINPDDNSAFEIQYLNSTGSKLIQSFSLSASGKPAQRAIQELKIVSSNARLDLLGTYYINVLLKNNSTETATNAIATAALYDKDGNVIALGKALADSSLGSPDISAGEQAAFGIVVTDKLQTYRTSSYVLRAGSDQYVSDRVLLNKANSTYGQNAMAANTKSGCLIATAAYGSASAPQVQQLRSFRDSVALSTVEGSGFMQAFNLWYYSFSPSVADYERQNSWLQGGIRVAMSPLLSILQFGTSVESILAFQKDAAIIVAGMTISAGIATAYIGPVIAASAFVTRKSQFHLQTTFMINSAVVALALTATLIGSYCAMPDLVYISAPLIVLSSMSVSLVTVMWLVRFGTVRFSRLTKSTSRVS